MRGVKLLIMGLLLNSTLGQASNLEKALENIRIKYKLPALAATLVTDNKILHISVHGKRAIDSKELVSINDKFHLGSNTKSMTGTLLGVMVENNLFNWNSSLSESFPQYKMNNDFKQVTLEQLMRHYGGTTHSLNITHQKLWHNFFYMQQEPGNNAREQRTILARTILNEPPTFKPGSSFHYSNTGISLVGHAIENKLSTDYETLLRNYLFSKLGMNSCGFGAPSHINQFDQPRGHVIIDGEIKSVNAGSITADNPDAISPAGKVHCSIGDWGKYIQEHLKGSRGKSKYLKTKTFHKLHSPQPGTIQGLGWATLRPAWSPNTNHIFHNGSNSMNYAEMWISPTQNYGVGVVTNIGNDEAKQAVRLAVKILAESILKNK